MNKNAIKKYAVWARRELISRVSQRAAFYEITEDGFGDSVADSVRGMVLTAAEKRQRRGLIDQIRQKGYQEVMEEVAYTWFNRFSALRFMEVNGYLPTHVRVFTDDSNAFKPQILTEAIHMEFDGLDMEKVYALKNGNQDEELFKYMIIAQCNALNGILPGMFQKIEDYTELLFPDNLLREGSVAEQMIALIQEEDWKDQVQIIGWLYQYYNSEKKDEVFAALKKNVKITKENIPAATQLFTPDWIVRYMVENSLGRLWVEGHPNDELKVKWKYYLEEAEQEPEVQRQLEEIRKEYAKLNPEDIRCIDPCMGSGHILCYMFDVLVQIYQAHGVQTRDAVRSIVESNLYGLDIDDRAAQLAYFSVMMKGRQYDSRFFKRGVQPNVYSPKGYEEGKEFGALLMVDELEEMPKEAEEYGLFDESYEEQMNRWQFRKVLAQKYDVVCTNPPYMAVSNASDKVQKYVKKNYPDSKSDLFACFIERCGIFVKKNGFQAMITQHAWMFLSSFEKLRTKLQMVDIINMAHLGARAFEEIGGEVVQTTSFVMRKSHVKDYKSTYCRLIDPITQQEKEDMFLTGENRYIVYQDNFSKIPGSPVAYWVSKAVYHAYEKYPSLGSIAAPRKGNSTSDNNRFLRLWHEVCMDKMNLHCQKLQREDTLIKRWFPYNKGGGYRKWYGFNEYLIDWYNDAEEIRAIKTAVIANYQYFMKPGLTWSTLTSGQFSIRWFDEGFIFDNGGCCIFELGEKRPYLCALLNSKVFSYIFGQLNPTLNFQSGEVSKFPVILDKNYQKKIEQLTRQNIQISKDDYNSFETSWDFICHPLVQAMSTVKEVYISWNTRCTERFNKLKSNEEELNRIFINIYGLQNELIPEVDDKDVTIHKADLKRDIYSLISYAVGCMFGRYSLDVEGITYAGGEWDASKYITFQPEKDAILPICDDDYFENDIINRFIQWVEVIYGTDTLEENLKFIADALGGKGNPRKVIRNYFLNEFYTNHCKMYQKRPIYWLFGSGKKGGFKCLIYMHRYQPDTIARIRTEYVHEQQNRYRTAIASLEEQISTVNTSERVKLNKRLKELQDQAEELYTYEEKIHHLADQMISIDLDDGVKHNYAIFQDVLAKIK